MSILRPHSTPKRHPRLIASFCRGLLLCVLATFLISSVFIFVSETRSAIEDTKNMLRLYINDVHADINDASDKNLLSLTTRIRDTVANAENADKALLESLLLKHDVSEINIIDKDGFIRLTTSDEYQDYDMRHGEQSAAFLELLDGQASFVQPYQPVAAGTGVSMKYAGVVFPDGGFVQVGYNAARFRRDIDEQIVGITRNRHVGESGFLIIADEELRIVSDPIGSEGKSLESTGLRLLPERDATRPHTLLSETVYGKPSYLMHDVTEGYYIIGVLPHAEVMATRNQSVQTTVAIEILVLISLFLLIYAFVRLLVVQNIHRINAALKEITGGNLDVTVDVCSHAEFAALSGDINATVNTLKGYIAEASARIDRELEIAKTIQFSSLPCVFPPYPDRSELDIFASMHTAREVGGDFYDFYILDDEKLVFLVADVSGKGISAAMFMMRAKTLIKGYAENSLDPANILTQTNTELCKNNEAGMFVSCWLGILDLKTGEVKFANAGHNPPLLRRLDGSVAFYKVRPDFVLGGLDGICYRQEILQLEPGDEIFLYTDGVTEASDTENHLFGNDRLLQTVSSLHGADAKALCCGVKKAVDAFAGGADQFDDITLLALRFLPTNTLNILPKEGSMPEVLDFVESTLEKADVPRKTITQLNIAADEVYSNILRYSGSSLVRIECDVQKEHVRLVFADNGTPYNPLTEKNPDISLSAEEREVGGLGIFLLKKMMDDIKYQYSGGQNVLTLIKKFKE